MKCAKGGIGAALDRPNPSVRFYLLHGADTAGSRALAQRLLASLGADKQILAGSGLKADPAALADEAGSISMFGGKRLLWIEPAGEEILPAVEALLAAPAIEHPAVAICNVLRKTSALLKLADAHPATLTHVSYLPEGKDADRLVIELGRREGLRIDPLLATRIAAAAVNDQAVIAQELAKFALYLGATPESPATLEAEVLEGLGADASEGEVGRAGDLALAGETQRLGDELERLESSGIEAIPVLRALQRRLLMLVPLRAKLDAGQRAEAVMASVFWKDKALISRCLSRWTSDRLAHAVDRVARLERDCLLSPVESRTALGHELLQIARAAAR